MTSPCIKVPSPQEIRNKLFPRGELSPPSFARVWTAQMLLTPFGGEISSPINPSDQLAIGNLTYEALSSTERCMRIGLYLSESLQYYAFFFVTSNGKTQWWWLVSDPDDPSGLPIDAFGPFPTTAEVPDQNFLARNEFAHVGTWKIGKRLANAFAARNTAQFGTWYWFAGSGVLTRVMNVDKANDFRVAVVGAYYLIHFPSVRRLRSSNLGEVYKICSQTTNNSKAPSPMVTLSDILTAMGAPPSGSQVKCTWTQIQMLIPGISNQTTGIKPPSWTSRVNSDCYMIGPHTYPYYSQVWYDWDRGTQVTVLVQQDEAASYTHRFDEILLKGTTGPVIVYSWNGVQWNPACCAAKQTLPMPLPDFVEEGDGSCRASVINNPYFGTVSIWSVELGDQNGRWTSNFWFWFDDHQRGTIFSLAPPHSLTIIDYQTFIQNGPIKACIFENPCDDIQPCSGNQIMTVRSRPKFSPPTA